MTDEVQFRYLVTAAKTHETIYEIDLTNMSAPTENYQSPDVPDISKFIQALSEKAETIGMTEAHENSSRVRGGYSRDIIGYIEHAYRWGTENGVHFIEFVAALLEIYAFVRKKDNHSKPDGFVLRINGRDVTIRPGEDVAEIVHRLEQYDVR